MARTAVEASRHITETRTLSGLVRENHLRLRATSQMMCEQVAIMRVS
ncbi:hypothetical protein [Ereboglobus luteus]|nr:hypothetical protein [Ereboglobus luteus]